jgi:hypothetical protein
MLYTGLDVHDQYTKVQVMDKEGFLAHTGNIPTTVEDLSLFFANLPTSTAVSFEAGRNYWWVSQLLNAHPQVDQLRVVDPRRSRNLAKELSVQLGYGRAKNDRIDAEMLAEILRRGMLPAIHLPTPAQLEQRTLVRHRCELVQESTCTASRIQGLLSMHGVKISTRSLREDFQRQLALLASLPGYVRSILHHLLGQIHLYQKQIRQCERRVSHFLPTSHQTMKLLMSAPGIGIVIARIIVSEILSISYFDGPEYLMSYSGLAPVEDDSAGNKGKIQLNSHCNYYLKYDCVFSSAS